MGIYHELIKGGEGLPIRAFIQSADRVKMHWHDDIEISLVLQGSVNIRVGNDIYILKENDLVVINNNAIHNTTETKEDNILLVLKINPHYYSKYYPEFTNVVFDCKSCDHGEEGQEKFDITRHHLAKIIWEFNKKKEDSKLMVGGEMHLLLVHLINNFKVAMKENEKVGNANKDIERIQRIISYMSENIEKGITLQEIADKEHLNVYYLSHFIKKMIGISFQEYLNYIRLDRSIKLLTTTNKTITAISHESGFPSTKSLNRIFKREFDCSPSEYRKDRKKMHGIKENKNGYIDKTKESKHLDVYISTAFMKLFNYLKVDDYNMERK
jgi:xylan 1,4-beta-xylosidase